jgi:hypothetical protein
MGVSVHVTLSVITFVNNSQSVTATVKAVTNVHYVIVLSCLLYAVHHAMTMTLHLDKLRTVSS